MKNFFILALCATFFSFIFSSCSTDDLPGVGVSKTIRVPHMCTEPELAPRYGCKGSLLPDPKVVGWRNTTDTLPGICNFTDKDLNDAGYFYKGKKEPALTQSVKSEGSASNLFFNIPWNWLGWLLFAGLAVLLFWLLWGLIRRLWAWATETLNRDGNITSSNTVVSETTSSTPPVADPGYRANYNNCTINNNDHYGQSCGSGNCCLSPKGELITEKITIERSYFDPRRPSTTETPSTH